MARYSRDGFTCKTLSPLSVLVRYRLTISSVRPPWTRPLFPSSFSPPSTNILPCVYDPNIINKRLCIHPFVADNDLSVLQHFNNSSIASSSASHATRATSLSSALNYNSPAGSRPRPYSQRVIESARALRYERSLFAFAFANRCVELLPVFARL
jgi:hypothetical protein